MGNTKKLSGRLSLTLKEKEKISKATQSYFGNCITYFVVGYCPEFYPFDPSQWCHSCTVLFIIANEKLSKLKFKGVSKNE